MKLNLEEMEVVFMSHNIVEYMYSVLKKMISASPKMKKILFDNLPEKEATRLKSIMARKYIYIDLVILQTTHLVPVDE